MTVVCRDFVVFHVPVLSVAEFPGAREAPGTAQQLKISKSNQEQKTQTATCKRSFLQLFYFSNVQRFTS